MTPEMQNRLMEINTRWNSLIDNPDMTREVLQYHQDIRYLLAIKYSLETKIQSISNRLTSINKQANIQEIEELLQEIKNVF